MLKKLASSFLAASCLVGTLAVPSIAADDKIGSMAFFPLRVLGCGVGTAVGVPLGMVRDGTKGAMQSTKWVAGKLGDENGGPHQVIGAMVGGPVGLVGGSAFGAFDGGWHGVQTGYKEPFSKDAFTFKDE